MKSNRDFNYMQRKRLDEQDAAYNVMFERERKASQQRMRERRPNLWGDKFARDMRHLAALGVLKC